MHDLTDTIIAVSSGTGARTIIRIAGDNAFRVVSRLSGAAVPKERAVKEISIPIEADFAAGGLLYTFSAPASYTGDELCEIHCQCCGQGFEAVYQKLLEAGCVSAAGGEFTYRAYLNGKMDISQAEAVAGIVSGSNQYQIAAGQKVLAGAIGQKTASAAEKTLELLSLLEAGLDFSHEDIEFISQSQALDIAAQIVAEIDELLSGTISFEQVLEADSVGLAGRPGSGKSSLVNAALGFARSIVSESDGTTRDVLSHLLEMKNCDCVLFDCAGLYQDPAGELEKAAQAAAVETLKSACVIVFCVDVSRPGYTPDLAILELIGKRAAVFAATKCDTLKPTELKAKLAELNDLFKNDFLATSARTGAGIDELKNKIEQLIISQRSSSPQSGERIAITKRHRQTIAQAAENIRLAMVEIRNQSNETAVMFLRNAVENLSAPDSEYIDEAVLNKIFSGFCIGK